MIEKFHTYHFIFSKDICTKESFFYKGECWSLTIPDRLFYSKDFLQGVHLLNENHSDVFAFNSIVIVKNRYKEGEQALQISINTLEKMIRKNNCIGYLYTTFTQNL